MTRTFSALAAATLLTAASLGGAASAGAAAAKSDVCHYSADTGTFQLINISDVAIEKHIAHGDAKPVDAVPGSPGNYFGADCEVMEGVAYGDVVWTSGPGVSGIQTTFTMFEGITDGDGYGKATQVNGDVTRVTTATCVRIDGYEVNWGGYVMDSTVASEIGQPIIGWAKDGATDMIGGWFAGFPGYPNPCSNAALTFNGTGTVTAGDLVVAS